MITPRAWVELDLPALKSNIAKLKGNSESKFLAVVKANAYGHGLLPIARAALAGGADWLGVALIEEALSLRENGITAPILAWLVAPGEAVKEAIAHDIQLSFSSMEVAAEIEAAGIALGKIPQVHIEVDTGMSRGGFLDQWQELLKYLPNAKLEVVGLWSHFARADEPERSETLAQIEKFSRFEQEINQVGIKPKFTHLSNSAGILGFPKAHRSIIRGGVAIYGLSPDPSNLGSGESLGLKPVMSIYAKLVLVKEVPQGAQVGYGGTKILERDSKIGVVALGYSDGLFRQANSTAGGYLAGKFAPLLGRISMDQCVVDLTDIPEAKTGDVLCMLGPAGCSAEQWAAAVGTINYEIVTRIPTRLPRVIKN
jgi:alanine racemase